MTDFSTLQSSEAILIDLDRVVHYTMNILYRKHFFLPKIQRICLSQLREHVAQSKLYLYMIFIFYFIFLKDRRKVGIHTPHVNETNIMH